MSNAQIQYGDGQIRKVKNLGWLLRNWQKVESFCFDYRPDDKRMVDGQLVANLRDGGKYVTDYASLSVCWNWLDRPVFRGLPLQVNNCQTLTQSGLTIGSDDYKAKNRLEYKQFMAEIV